MIGEINICRKSKTCPCSKLNFKPFFIFCLFLSDKIEMLGGHYTSIKCDLKRGIYWSKSAIFK